MDNNRTHFQLMNRILLELKMIWQIQIKNVVTKTDVPSAATHVALWPRCCWLLYLLVARLLILPTFLSFLLWARNSQFKGKGTNSIWYMLIVLARSSLCVQLSSSSMGEARIRLLSVSWEKPFLIKIGSYVHMIGWATVDQLWSLVIWRFKKKQMWLVRSLVGFCRTTLTRK